MDLAKIINEENIVTFAKRDELLQILNTNPPDQLIHIHPLLKSVKYIPIDKIEMMLTKIFQQWKVEILREGQLLNSIYVTIRLHYRDPITLKWEYQDGIGAIQIQVDKGETPSNLASIKPHAIMLGLPAAESFAVKDAAEKIGKVFGKDLNRREAIAFTPSYNTEETRKQLQAKIAKTVKKVKK